MTDHATTPRTKRSDKDISLSGDQWYDLFAWLRKHGAGHAETTDADMAALLNSNEKNLSFSFSAGVVNEARRLAHCPHVPKT